MSMTRIKRAIWFLIFLGALGCTSSLLYCGPSSAAGPFGAMGGALWERFMGLVSGPWVGQVDPRTFATPGETIEYMVYYSNNGPAVSGVSLVDLLPGQCALVSVESQPPHSWNYDPQNRRLVVDLGTLESSQGGTVRVVAQVDAAAQAEARLANTVQLWRQAIKVDESISAPTIVQAPNIVISFESSQPIERCGEPLYTLTCTNTGNLGANALTVTVTLPQDVVYVPSLRVVPPTSSGQTLVWSDLFTLAPDESRSLLVRAHVLPTAQVGALITCTASVAVQLLSGVTLESGASRAGIVETGLCPVAFMQVYKKYNADMDTYEPDDRPELASILETGVLFPSHTFHKYGDEDWVRFYALAGVYYLVETYDLSAGAGMPGTDTTMAIYEPNLDPYSEEVIGALVCESDDRRADPLDPRSACCFRAQTRGWYYVRIRSKDPSVYGRAVEYKARAMQMSDCSLY
jgi:uncharacterized repeat protein (TIGR01451 family)